MDVKHAAARKSFELAFSQEFINTSTKIKKEKFSKTDEPGKQDRR